MKNAALALLALLAVCGRVDGAETTTYLRLVEWMGDMSEHGEAIGMFPGTEAVWHNSNEQFTRAWLTFGVPPSGRATSASLYFLAVAGISSHLTPQTIVLHKTAFHFPGSTFVFDPAIYADLGDGPVYGTATIDVPDGADSIFGYTIVLNETFLADYNAKRGPDAQITIGIDCPTAYPADNGYSWTGVDMYWPYLTTVTENTTSAQEDPVVASTCVPCIKAESDAQRNGKGNPGNPGGNGGVANGAADATAHGKDLSPDPVHYSNGELRLVIDDIRSNAFGGWGQRRSYSNRSAQLINRNGFGWFDDGIPQVVQTSLNTYSVVAGADRAFGFTWIGSAYVAQDYHHEQLVAGTGELIFTDTLGNQTHYFDFSAPEIRQGQFKSYTDCAGNAISATYDGSGHLLHLDQSITVAGVTTTDTFVYTYHADDTTATVKRQVTIGAGSPVTVREADYEYYTGASGEFGEGGDLKRVTIKDGATPTPNIIEQMYYRYYRDGDADGFRGALKYSIDPASYARMVGDGKDPLTATDADMQAYSDGYFKYDEVHRVTWQSVKGSGCSCANGAGSFVFAYSPSANGDAYGNWHMKTVEQQLDMDGTTPLYTRTVYTNFAGEVLLTAMQPASGTAKWIDCYQYDSAGRPTLHAEPSAVAGFDDTAADLGVSLNSSSGLIHRTNYGTSTTATTSTPGNVVGYVQSEQIEHGSSGTPITLQTTTYIAHQDGSGNTVYKVATDTQYRNSDGSGAQTTSHAYTWAGSSNLIQSDIITKPAVITGQNGPGTAESETVVFDAYARVQWTKDGDGFLSYRSYDPASGGMTSQIVDVNTANTGDFTNLPSGWATPSSGGLHLKTVFNAVDLLARPTQITDPVGNVTYAVYKDAAHERRTYPGWQSGTLTTTGPTMLVRDDQAGEYHEELTMSATPAASGGAPTGTEAVSGLQTLVRTYLEPSHRPVQVDRYISFSSLTYSTAAHIGTLNTNYTATTFGYDAQGHRDKVAAADGTISRTVFDALDRPISSWIGTNDAPSSGEWSPGNNGSPANMVRVTANQYDGGSVGDGNLTQVTAYPDSGATNDRVTQHFFDWRDRLVASKQGVQWTEASGVHRPIVYCDLDNLGECTASYRFDGDDITITTTGGVPDQPSSSLLRAKTAAGFDEQNRPYQVNVYAVDQSNGAISSTALTTSTWYNLRSLPIKMSQPGGLVTKTAYDGAGRTIRRSCTDGGGDATWADAANQVGDAVLEQQSLFYDADGNVLITTTQCRNHDESATGDLGNATTTPKARVSYQTGYFDAANRRTASVDVGTNGGSAYARPGSVPTRSDTALVTSWTFNAAGWVETLTDPRAILSKRIYDVAGRTTSVIEAYDASINGGNPSGSNNRTTTMTYNPVDRVLTQQAVLPAGANSQTTRYTYGVTLSVVNDVNSNALLAKIQYPDKSTGAASTNAADQETFTYNALGQRKSSTDGNGSTHTFVFDVLGRGVSDAVTNFGSGVDTAVQRLERAFDTGGRPYLFTSYGAASAGTVVNQVQRSFNGLGQLVTEWQNPNGAVNTGTSPKVQYAYTLMSGGANNSRRTSMTYPNNRILRYEYSSGLDANISRISFLADDSSGSVGTHLEEYQYLGANGIVRRAHPEPGVDLTYTKLSTESTGDAGDQYTGLDRFGRVVDQRWLKVSTGAATDRFQYAYDRSSQALYKNNLLSSKSSDLYHTNGAATNGAYDPLGRMTEYRRGTLSASGNNGTTLDTVTHANDPNHPDPIYASQVWTLDQLGSWATITSDGTAVNRTHNSQNELTGFSSTTITYDNNGNLQSQTGTTSNTWDAWNRGKSLRGYAYTYDALGRRVTESGTYSSQTFYYNGFQLIENSPTSAPKRKEQFVWSLAYIDCLVLRDRDADGSSGTGNFGISGSGLEERFYAQQDRMFNQTALVDTSGAVQERYLYDPYGSVAFVVKPSWAAKTSSAYANNIGFTGQYHDANGLIHFRRRPYEPILGRFIGKDPIGYIDGMNLYAGYFVPNGVDPSGLLLIAVDGTGSEDFLDTAPLTSTGRRRSHTRNFYDDYSGAKAYWNGPKAGFWYDGNTGSDSAGIHAGIMKWLKENWCKHQSEPIDLVGHSRGGYIVMEVARTLQNEGIECGGCKVKPRIRFMGLYDPVDSAPGFGDDETVPANVDQAEVVFPNTGGTREVTDRRGDTYRVPEYPKSRSYFNRADHGAENQGQSGYHETFIPGTHAALGGDPWGGDHPGGLHSRAHDNGAAQQADEAIRQSAQNAGINVPTVVNYGY